jgi:hypothetical protein
MWSTEDGGSRHDLHGCRWARAQAGDEEADTKNVSEVEGPCGAPPASILLPATVLVAPLPKRPSARGQGTARLCGDKSWTRVQGFELGKRGRMADEVHFIGAQPGINTRGLRPALIARGIIGFDYFSFKIKSSISLVKPSLYCLHHSGLQRAGSAWAHDGTWARLVGMARTMNRALGPCPHRRDGPQRIWPKLGKRENKTLQTLIRKKR